MDYRSKLYFHKNIYDNGSTDDLFLEAVKKNIEFHRTHCRTYDRLLDSKGFQVRHLKHIDDLYKLPFLPTLYLKHHKLQSMEERKIVIKATSSGTSGKQSQIGYDWNSLTYGAVMAFRMAWSHGLFSLKPVNYLILGYQPHKSNQTVVNKTQRASMLFAPALRWDYALKYGNKGYYLDLAGMKETLKSYGMQKHPVRIIGFPAYMYILLKELQKEGIRLKLPKQSMILLGGGWKDFYKEQVEKPRLYQLAEEVLGIEESRCREFFGAVEHPGLYCDCKNHHFHIPVFNRILIRDVDTLKPVAYGTAGLVNLISPMVESMPLVSVTTDDLGILHDGKDCGCGNNMPYLEIIGRVGISDVKTCTQEAREFL